MAPTTKEAQRARLLDQASVVTQDSAVQFYESPDHQVHLRVRLDGETVWLSRNQLAMLFGRDVKTIGKHVANALREELVGIPTVANFATVQQEGSAK